MNLQKPYLKTRELLLSLLSGLLLVLSFVPWDFSALAWVAFIPLCMVLLPRDESINCEYPFIYAYLTGCVFWFGTVYWLVHVTIPGMIAMAFYLAIYFGLWGVAISKIRSTWSQVHGVSHILIALFSSATWVGLEWVRSWMISGFPWNNLGVSQYSNISLIQLSAWTGVYGLSFVVLFFNITLWLTFRRMTKERFSFRSWRYEFTVAIFMLFFTMAFGLKSILHERQHLQEVKLKSVTLGLVQPDVPQAVKYEPMSRQQQHDRLRLLSKKILEGRDHKPVDLVLWPETAIVDGPSFHEESRLWLQTVVKELNVPVLFGTLDAVEGEPSSPNAREFAYFNSATMITPSGGFSDYYHKIHLVPFGEYIPFEKSMPWMKWLTPIRGGFGAGEKPVLFNVAGLKAGPVICFEDTLPVLTRKVAASGADLLVNLTNDAWFKTSIEPEMHAVNSLFRAVETRRPLVRCTNHGLTTVVNSLGQIVFRGEPFKMNYFSVNLEVPTEHDLTFYSRHGDVFAYGCLFLAVLVYLYCRVRTIRALSRSNH